MFLFFISAYMDTEKPKRGSFLLFNESNGNVGAFELNGEIKYDLGVKLYKTQYGSLKIYFPQNKLDRLPLEKATAANIQLGMHCIIPIFHKHFFMSCVIKMVKTVGHMTQFLI